jgi:hypothetical protein
MLPYINLLINSKKIDEAAVIWDAAFPADTLLYNGSFASPLLKNGFGWRIWEKNGVQAERVTKGKDAPSLHLHFSGTENINYSHTRQYVPVSPGQRYVLSGTIRSQGLTTDQLPQVEVVGLHCSMPVTTVPIAATQDWTAFQVEFSSTDQCNAIQVRIRRKPSRSIDSLIKGDIWLTDLALHQKIPAADQSPLNPER